MTKDEALKLALSALDEVRQETFRLMKDSQTLYSEKKVWYAIYTIKKVLAQPQQEPLACKRCKQLEEQAYDLLGELKVANIKLSMQPQRTWVGLTDEEIDQGLLRTKYAMQTAGAWRDGVEWAIKQLQEKNT